MEEVKEITQSPIKISGDKAVLFKAYCNAQKSMGEVLKKATNPAFKSKYADLSAVVEAITPPFNDNGFAVIQSPTYNKEQGVLIIELLLGHESGGWIETQLTIPVTKHDAQGIGSAITYARRYQLLAISGAAPEDDDGNAASEKVKQEPKQEPVFITAEQVAIIQNLIDETNTDIEMFIKWVKVPSLNKIPTNNYDKVIDTLKAKLSKKAVE